MKQKQLYDGLPIEDAERWKDQLINYQRGQLETWSDPIGDSKGRDNGLSDPLIDTTIHTQEDIL